MMQMCQNLTNIHINARMSLPEQKRNSSFLQKKITGKNLLLKVQPYWTIPENMEMKNNEYIIS